VFRQFLNKFVLAEGIGAAFRRFPLSYACCILLYLLFLFSKDQKPFSFMAVTGIPLVIGYFWFGIAALISESRSLSALRHGLLAFGGFAVLVLISWFGGDGPYRNSLGIISGLVVLVSVAPFLNKRHDDKNFWVYNRGLWIGVFTAISFGIVLSLGLNVILFSIGYLFGLQLTNSSFYITTFVAMVYTPGLALLWVPKSEENDEVHFGPECRVLVNWLLAPLLTVYTIILYAYAVKIGLFQELPKGKLAGMIIGFGVVGLMTYMAAWPVRDHITGLWHLVTRYFFRVMILPIALMALAIGVRIHEYGITPDRYMVVVLLLWFLVVTAIYIRRNPPGMKWIPLLLSVALLLTSFGPWGARAVSGYSQAARLSATLKENGIFVAGRIVPVEENTLSIEAQKDISAGVGYLLSSRQLHRVHPSFKKFYERPRKGNQAAIEVMQSMGLNWVDRWGKAAQKPIEGKNFNLSQTRTNNTPLTISGYDLVVPGVHDMMAVIKPGEQWERDIAADPEGAYPAIKLKFDEARVLQVHVEGRGVLQFDINTPVQQVLAQGKKELPDNINAVSDGDLRGKIQITRVSGKDNMGQVLITAVSFRLLLDL
jgi:hypothetical protein